MLYKLAWFLIGAGVPQTEARLGMPDWEIKEQRDRFIEITKGLIVREIINEDRARDRDQEWRCEEDFKEYREKGWMDDADIEQWRRNKASPDFTSSGRYAGILRQCGCFHPMSMVLSYDPRAGKEVELSAADIVGRRNDLWLAHLAEGTKDGEFVHTYSPLRMTTHGREMFDLVVIFADNGRTLRVTRNHGILVFPGVMVQARNVTLDDKLYDINGNLIGVKGLGSEGIEDEVVNFETNPMYFKGQNYQEHPLEHVIFASGLAVGDLRWQNDYTAILGKMLW